MLNDAEALLRAGMNVFLSVYSHFPPAMFYFTACSLIHLFLRVIPVEINPDTQRGVFLITGCIKNAEEKGASNNSIVSFSPARSRALQDISGCFRGLSETRFIPDAVAQPETDSVARFAPLIMRSGNVKHEIV